MKTVVLFFFIIFNFNNQAQTTVAFTTPGTSNWTVPACVSTITVQVWGAGGGGGGASSNQNTGGDEACSEGGGGGGGGFVSRVYSVVTGEVYTIVVGAGGTAGPGAGTNLSDSPANIITGSNNNKGGNGGNSTFNGPATVAPGILTAYGGTGGGGAWSRNQSNGFTSHQGTNGTGGNGGGGLNGTTTFNGGIGSPGAHSGSCYDVSGAGGGGAGTTSNGANGSTATGCVLRTGGAGGTVGGGAGGDGKKLVSYSSSREFIAGNAGVAIGGGGSGAMIHLHSWPNTWTNAAGGAGARGEVRILYNAGTPPTLSIITPACNTNSTNVNLIANAGSTISPTYVWSNSGGNINSGGSSLTPNVNSPGNYTLVAYNSGAPTCSVSASISLTTLNCNLLPIELASIYGERINSIIEIKWETFTEINNDYFILEKSKDGISFEAIKVVKSAINGYQINKYLVIDDQTNSDLVYYRLVQVDYSGRKTYSKTITIESIKEKFQIYPISPNPTEENTNLSLYSESYDELQMEIYELSGRLLKVQFEKIHAGYSNININTSDLNSGLYFLSIKLINGNHKSLQKIIKN